MCSGVIAGALGRHRLAVAALELEFMTGTAFWALFVAFLLATAAGVACLGRRQAISKAPDGGMWRGACSGVSGAAQRGNTHLRGNGPPLLPLAARQGGRRARAMGVVLRRRPRVHLGVSLARASRVKGAGEVGDCLEIVRDRAPKIRGLRSDSDGSVRG